MAKMFRVGRFYVVIEADSIVRRKLIEMQFAWHPGPCVIGGTCPLCAFGVPQKSWYSDNKVQAYVVSRLSRVLCVPGLFDEMEENERKSSSTGEGRKAGKLYPFQQDGVDHICSRPHTLLADEMGTGKTIQILCAMNRLKPRMAVVVCPASLRTNWKREAERWATGTHISVVRKHSDIKHDPPSRSLFILGYETLSNPLVLKELESPDFLAFDESSRIKNPKAKRTKSALQIARTARRVVFANGTPVMNNAAELWTTLSIICPDYVGNFFRFRERFCCVEKKTFWRDQKRVTKRAYSGVQYYDELNALLRGGGFMIRRKKMDVLKQLPDKVRSIVELDVDSSTLSKAEAEARCFDELEQLKQMRLSGDIGLEYRDKAQGLQEQINAKAGELSRVRKELGVAKLPLIKEFVADVLEQGKKIVLFFHHREVGEKLREHFSKSVLYYGGMSDKAKQAAVDAFQDGGANLFLGSISSAGVGLTLTSSSCVVMAELDWVPAMVLQAEDRCHRNGQKNVVNVYHLVVDGSVDARIAKRIISKADTAHRILDDEWVRLTREA